MEYFNGVKLKARNLSKITISGFNSFSLIRLTDLRFIKLQTKDYLVVRYCHIKVVVRLFLKQELIVQLL